MMKTLKVKMLAMPRAKQSSIARMPSLVCARRVSFEIHDFHRISCHAPVSLRLSIDCVALERNGESSHSKQQESKAREVVLTIARRYLKNGALASPLYETLNETEKHTEVARREFFLQ